MKLLLDHPQILFALAALAFTFFKRYSDWKKTTQDGHMEQTEKTSLDRRTPPTRKQMPYVPPPIARNQTPPPLAKTHMPAPLDRTHAPTHTIKSVPPAKATIQTPDRATLLKRQQDRLDRQQHAKDNRTTTHGGAQATRARIAGNTTLKSATVSGLRAQLCNHKEIRKAILLNEILGLPVSLR